ncbi:unnamed protein product, partial [Scytosiphon promiscuus]
GGKTLCISFFYRACSPMCRSDTLQTRRCGLGWRGAPCRDKLGAGEKV